MKNYHLLLACDQYYLSYMFVACQSVLNGIKNSSTGPQDNEQIIFHILIDNSVDEARTNALAASFCKRNDFITSKFCFYNSDSPEFNDTHGWGEHQSKSTLYRLLLNRFLPQEISLLLYIDIDVLVLGDVRELLNRDLGQKVLGSVYDHTCYLPNYSDGKILIKPHKKASHAPVATLAEENYFNAGVLLINMDQWRQQNIESKTIKFVQNYNPRLLDQDALNYCTEQNLALDWSWNFQTWMFYVDKEHYTDKSGYVHLDSNKNKSQFKCNNLPIAAVKQGLAGCNIIHFTACKPWKEQPFIASDDQDRCIFFNEQVIKSIKMWQELAAQTPECQGVHIPHTTIESVLGDLANHNAHNIYRANQLADKKRRKLRKFFISLCATLALLQIITILLLL